MKVMTLSLFFLTSVMALSPAQRSMRRHSRGASPRVTMKGTIKEVLDSGRVLVLNDDSKWVIAPRDIQYTGGWLGPAPVFVVLDGSMQEEYPYTITNTWTDKRVQARAWSEELDIDRAPQQNEGKPPSQTSN